jgi:hypothetical protein
MQDLHIRLYEQKGKFLAEIVESPSGSDSFARPDNPQEWPCPLVLPKKLESGHGLEDFQGALLELKQGEAVNELQAIGNYLYHFLFGPKGKENVLYKYWLESFKQSQQADGMRTVLHLDSDRLLGVPWELICDDNGRYLAALPNPKPHSLIRSRWKADGLSMAPVALPKSLEPLRALVVICHAPDDDVLIKGPDEALRVDSALFELLPWKVDLRVLVRPTFKEVREWCNLWQPHVFHYVGHGGDSDTGPYLQFYEPGQVDTIPLDAAAMANFFTGGAPRLVVLNACRSGQIGGEEISASASAKANQSLCKVLIEGGTLAVIAMQADIEGQAAAKLLGEFYRSLAHGAALDLALTAARQSYFGEAGLGTKKWDWALPALYLSEGAKAEEVLLLDQNGLAPKVFPPENQDLQLLVKIQVGRDREQMALERALLRADLNSVAPVTLLYGEPEMGKSTLLYWLSEGCARRGRQFIYADFRDNILDYLDALRLIRDGRLETKISGGVILQNNLNSDLIFNFFNYTLNSKLVKGYANKHRTAPGPETPVADEAWDKKLNLELGKLGTVRSKENPLETINEAFWSGLVRAAEPNGLIIFLDHIYKTYDAINQLKTYLVERVLNPDKYPNARKVRLVLAVRERTPEMANLERPWDYLLANPKVVVQHLGGFQPAELSWLARVWARRYFLSHSPIEFKDKHLTPEKVDEYVSGLLNPNYLKRAQRPGRLISDLLNDNNIEDWLYNLGDG